MARRTAWGAIAVAVVVLLGVAALALRPVDRAGYRALAGQATEDSLSAVRTLARATRADLSGKVTAAYLTVVVRDAQEDVAASLRELTTQEVPDETSRAVRNRVLPLLTAAAAAIGDVGLTAGHGDEAAVRAAADALDLVGDQLHALAGELR
jgi:hypothetical protein